MGKHLHLIIESSDGPLQDIMRDLKKHTAKEIIKVIEENPRETRKEWMLWMKQRAGQKNANNRKYQFWQQHNQPIVLSNPIAFEQKLNYIHENPVKAGWVEPEEEYLYPGAKDYSEQKGLVKVVVAR